MDELILEFYSNGDLYMLFAKVITWMIILASISVVLGCIRGLRL